MKELVQEKDRQLDKLKEAKQKYRLKCEKVKKLYRSEKLLVSELKTKAVDLKNENQIIERKCKDMTKQLNEQFDVVAKLKHCQKNCSRVRETEQKCEDLAKTFQDQVKTFDKERITLQTQKNFFKMKYNEKCSSKKEHVKFLKHMIEAQETEIVKLDAKVNDLKSQVLSVTKKLNNKIDLVDKMKEENSRLEKMFHDVKKAKEIVVLSDCSDCEENCIKIKETEEKCENLSKTLEEKVKTFEQDKLALQIQKNFYKMKYDQIYSSDKETVKLLRDMLKKRDTQNMDLEARVSDLKNQLETAQKNVQLSISNFSFDHDASNNLVKTEIKTETKY